MELVSTMDVSSCVRGNKRSLARRGAQVIFWYDNRPNFVGAEKKILVVITTLVMQNQPHNWLKKL